MTATALLSVGAASGCGSSSSNRALGRSQQSSLGGQAPAQLVGTFKTTLSRRDLARAPQPGEMSVGSWTLVIGNRGGPGNERALAIGPGDTDRAVYRFGIHGNRLSIGCTDNHGLPTSGSQTYLWSIHEHALALTPASAKCKQGDPDTQLILTRHTWTKQGTH